MKNTLLKILVLYLLACCMLFVFSACDETNTLPNGGGTNQEQNIDDNGGGDDNSTSDTVNANSVSLNNTSVSISVGDNMALVATVLPANTKDKTITWTSSNTSIATVQNGIVTAKKAGTATITATTVNGKTATCFVTVNKNDISFNTLQMDGLTAYGKVSNETEIFSFINEIKVLGNVSYSVSTDLQGNETVSTKTVNLKVGDNTFYVLVSSKASDDLLLYTVTVRRRPVYTVSFNTNGGSNISNQYIEEDFYATYPAETKKDGYTFVKWDYNFNNPITRYQTISAEWRANTNTAYKIEYYLQNLADDNYTLTDTDNLTGTTDTMAVAQIKSYAHFTPTSNNVSGNINGNGSTVLKVYYTRDKYTFTVQNANTNGGSITCTENGTYQYGKEISLNATANDGYTFTGWFNGETKISGNLSYIFEIAESCNIVASWQERTDITYRVEHYRENIYDNNYTLYETEDKSGTTGTVANATVKSYDNFTHSIISDSLESSQIQGNGTTTLRVYYKRNLFRVSIVADNENITLNKNEHNGDFKYGYEIQPVTATLNGYLGYDKFTGWYKNNTLYSESNVLQGFIVDSTVTFNATCSVVEEMANFYFNSTDKTCTISGIKDKTVTEIIVPDYITEIRGGAFNGCSKLITITIPFVGALSGTTSQDTYQYPFGYIFGTNNYSGSTRTQQYYYGNSITTFTNTNYFIPSSLTTVNVTGGNILFCAFNRCANLTTVNLPSDLIVLGDDAFYNCSSLKNIILPSNLESLGSQAFYNCCSLTDLVLPQTLRIIGSRAFQGCNGLTELSVPDNVISIGDYAFSGCNSLQYNEYDNAYYLGNSNNLYLALIKAKTTDKNSYNINSDTKILYGEAFLGCGLLSSVSLSENIVYLGGNVFRNCISLIDISIPNSVNFIGEGVFSGCSSLERISIPFVGDSAKTGSDTYQYPFGYIFGTSSYSRGVATKQNYYGSSLKSTVNSIYYIPSTLRTVVVTGGDILYGAFYNCNMLTNITIDNSIHNIASGALSGCSALESLVLPFIGDMIKTTGNMYQYPFGYIFGEESYNGGALTEQYYHINSTSSIRKVVYFIPTTLKYVTITGGNILRGAFYQCEYLTNIILPSNITKILENAFYGCKSLMQINIPENVTTIDKQAFFGCSSLLRLDIPDNVVEIGVSAFNGCSSLTNITIPDSVIRLGDAAFYNCSLIQFNSYDNGYYIGNDDNPYVILIKAKTKTISSCTIHNDTKFIYNNAFSGCTSLTVITIPDNVLGIGVSAFSGSAIKKAVLGNNVVSIGQYAFSNCNSLSTFKVEKNLKHIEYCAFSSSNIRTITFNGTKAEWQLINKSDEWDKYTNISSISCSDGTISL